MKKFITIAAMAAFLSLGTATVSAQSTADVIAQLQAQLAALMSGSTVTSESMLSAHAGVNLTVGSTGTRVMELQACMNTAGYNTGVVDGIYGPNTATGVKAFQLSKGLVADGIVGMATTPAFQAACPINVVVEVEITDEEEAISEFDTTGGEEGELISGSIKVRSGDDDELFSETRGQEAFTFEVEAEEEGSDVLIERIDLTFSITGDETKAYKVIDAVSIEVDGEELASEDTDSKNNWRGSADDTVRMSDVNAIVKADEKVEFSIMLDLAELDLDTTDTVVTLTEIDVRYIDAAGITSYEKETSITETATAETLVGIDFDLDESNDNPDDETVSLNEDVDGVVVFVNDLEIDDESGTIEDVTVTVGLDADLSAFDIDDLVADAAMMVDGDSIDADDINAIVASTTVGTCDDSTSTDKATCEAGDGAVDAGADGATTLDGDGVWTSTASSFTIDFDTDEMEVEVDDKFEISLELDLSELDSTVAAEAAFIGVELKATSIVFAGDDSSEDSYTAAAVNIDNAPEVNISAGALSLDDSQIDGYNTVGSDDDAAKVTFTVEVKADGDEDMRVDAFVFSFDNLASETIVAGAAASDTDYTVTVKDGDDDVVTGAFVINDGSSETFEITVFFDNVGNSAGEFDLELETITWTEDTADNGFTGSTTAGTLEVSLEADSIDLVA